MLEDTVLDTGIGVSGRKNEAEIDHLEDAGELICGFKGRAFSTKRPI